MSATGEHHTTGLGEATTAGQVNEAGDALLMRAMEYALARDGLADFRTSAHKYREAQHRYWLAARDLTAAVDELDPDKRPTGWGLGPGAETA